VVSNLTIIFIAISAIISIILPIVTAIYFYKKYKISFKNVAVGALIFFVFVIILEALMHRYILIINTTTSVFFSNPWLYAIYGAFAAGIFEETGRFVGYRFLLKGRTERKDALAYGIGHGGLEAILLGGIASIQNLVFAVMINNGTLNAKLPEVTAQQIHNSLISTSSYLFLLGGFERAFAFAIDFPAALFQKEVITNMWIIEGMYALVAFICLILIIKSKKYYEKELV
jgi:uncharacterized membrane protein YhfC